MKINVKKKLLIAFLLVVILSLTCGFIYVNNYYHAETKVQKYFKQDGTVHVEEIKEGVFLNGKGEESALIFYPGAKVEYTAYIPILYELADQGIDCFLIKMPCNLAFLGQNKADEIISAYEYEHWYIGGHSLGGAMAASYAAGKMNELEGLALLAAYPTKELKAENFSVLSIYGSEDGVLNHDKVTAGRQYMPEDYTELCIEGGNHAGFGNYGPQKGDHEASISQEEQQKQTVAAILDMAGQ